MVAKTTIFRNYDARKMSENYAVSAGIARERTSTNQMCSSFSPWQNLVGSSNRKLIIRNLNSTIMDLRHSMCLEWWRVPTLAGSGGNRRLWFWHQRSSSAQTYRIVRHQHNLHQNSAARKVVAQKLSQISRELQLEKNALIIWCSLYKRSNPTPLSLHFHFCN